MLTPEVIHKTLRQVAWGGDANVEAYPIHTDFTFTNS